MARIGISRDRIGPSKTTWIAALLGSPMKSERPVGAWAVGVSLPALILALAALAVSVAPALAAPPTTTAPVVSGVSYTTAHLAGTVTTDGSGLFGNTAYAFQYSTDQTTWSNGYESGFGTNITGPATDAPVEADITLPKGGTTYFVRLVAQNGFFLSDPQNPEGVSPAPDPELTTLPVDPPAVLAIDDVSNVGYTTAHVSGEIERPASPTSPGPGVDNAFDVDCQFQYVTEAQFQATGFETPGSVPCEPNPIHAEGASKVEANIAGLVNNTTYHLRLFVSNASPTTDSKEAASPFTTLSVNPPGVVSVADASDITAHTAKVEGVVERPASPDPAFNVDCRFEYISDQQLTENEGNGLPPFEGAETTPCTQNPVEAEGQTPVSAELGLHPNTTYHYRLIAENQGGSDTKDATNTFTTLTPDLPIVVIDPIDESIYGTARISGRLEVSGPPSRNVRPAFEISTDGGANWSILEVPSTTVAETENGVFHVENEYTGLQPNTTYTFRIAGTYGADLFPQADAYGEVSYSAEETITTEPFSPPTSEGLEATGVTDRTAHLSAVVDPRAPSGPLSDLAKRAFATHWEFVCVPECKNANGNSIQGTVQGEEGAQVVGGDAKRLEPNQHYEVSLIVKSEGGEEVAGPVTFNTSFVEPSIKPAPGGTDGRGGWILQGVVNPNNSPISDCHFEYGPTATYPNAYEAPCSPMPQSGSRPITVEAHLEGLTLGATYHFRLFATNGAGTGSTPDGTFVPIGESNGGSCPNELLRTENHSSSLPECRAYEMVTPQGKEGFSAEFVSFFQGERLHYRSESGNIAKSGQNAPMNQYVAARSATGWETIPNLNGSSGSLYDAPTYLMQNFGGFQPEAYSSDLLSSIWNAPKKEDQGLAGRKLYLRGPDGTFRLIGSARIGPDGVVPSPLMQSADLTHVLTSAPGGSIGGGVALPSEWGAGIYEFVGLGVDQPRRVDLDNLGDPISACTGAQARGGSTAYPNAISSDGRSIILTAFGGCGAANPPVDEIWARIDGTTSISVSASHCTRGDAEPCNGVSQPSFVGSTPNGSRVFFTTAQQLVNADTDEGQDIYACDIPSGDLTPVGKANSCATLIRVSDSLSAAAEVEQVISISEDGSAVMFTAKGVLAPNDGALGEEAVAGDLNLYVWRQDATHSGGEVAFVGRLFAEDIQGAQSTPDGHYVVFASAAPLVPTDTDSARDVYRYDTMSDELSRISTATAGTGGNGEGVDAALSQPARYNSHPGVSNDGQKIVFSTPEALSSADGNGESDIYLWTPSRVSLISPGSVGAGAPGPFAIDESGNDIYFQTPGALTPADGDGVIDVYDARVNGGFSFGAPPTCIGEECQPSTEVPAVRNPATAQPPADPGNLNPRACPRKKVLKGKKCIRKPKSKRHRNKKKAGARHHKKQGKDGYLHQGDSKGRWE